MLVGSFREEDSGLMALTYEVRALVAFVGDAHSQGQLLMTERPAPSIYYLKPTVA